MYCLTNNRSDKIIRFIISSKINMRNPGSQCFTLELREMQKHQQRRANRNKGRGRDDRPQWRPRPGGQLYQYS